LPEYSSRSATRSASDSLLLQLSHDRSSRDATAVRFADLEEGNLAGLVDDERRGIRGFGGRVPADAVGVGELVVGIQQHGVAFAEFAVAREFLGAGFQIVAGAGVNEEYAGIGVRDAFGLAEQVTDLP
jgi:hypothetical protein